MTDSDAPLDPVWLTGSMTLLAAGGFGLFALGFWPLSLAEGAVVGLVVLLLLSGTAYRVRRHPVYRALAGGLVASLGLVGMAGPGAGVTESLVVIIGVWMVSRAAVDAVRTAVE